MSKTILVVGVGPGISNAVAEKFGSQGFSVALVARNADRLATGVKALESKGIKAAAFQADATDPASIKAAVAKASSTLGPISVVHWNAYGKGGASDLLAADPKDLYAIFDVPVIGLVSTIQAALPDLKKDGKGAVLVTNGGFGYLDPQIDAYAVGSKNADLALANAAKMKLVGLLSAQLKDQGVYVGEVTVTSTVKGTAWDQNGDAKLEPSAIAAKFWELFEARGEIRARI